MRKKEKPGVVGIVLMLKTCCKVLGLVGQRCLLSCPTIALRSKIDVMLQVSWW